MTPQPAPRDASNSSMKKYFIFQFAKFGDCLFATIVAKQIKHDEPSSHITWGIAGAYKSILEGNPHVDKVVDLDVDPVTITDQELERMEARIEQIIRAERIDEMVYLQVHSRRHLTEFRTTLRHTVFKVCGRPITVSPQAVVNLTALEKKNVADFVELNRLNRYSKVVLFECAPSSGQAGVDVDFALEVAQRFTKKHADACFVLTSPSKLPITSPQIVDGSALSYRENLDLINASTVLVGSSSGISWLTIAEGAKTLPMLQLMNPISPIFAGMNFDFRIQGIDSGHIIERTTFSVDLTVECLNDMFQLGVAEAKRRWNQDFLPGRHHLETNMLRLVWLGYPMKQLFDYGERFVRENERYGNVLPIGTPHIAAMIATCYLKRLIFKVKVGLRPIRIMFGSRKAES